MASDNGSAGTVMSADGRYIAFSSAADHMVGNLPAGGTNNVYVRDTRASTTIAVSDLACVGTAFACGSDSPSISADGRYVAFESRDSALYGGTGTIEQVYVRDTSAGTTTLISTNASGQAGTADSTIPKISPDGSYVAFRSESSFVAADTNAVPDVYVRKVSDPATIALGSISTTGGAANDQSNTAGSGPLFSSDNRYLVFTSAATNLVSSDTNPDYDVFRRDLTQTQNATSLVDVTAAGVEADAGSEAPSISADGRYVAFASFASTLAPDPTVPGCYSNGGKCREDYVKDMTSPGPVSLASVEPNGNGVIFLGFAGDNSGAEQPFLSGNGHYMTFTTKDGNVVPGDSNNSTDVFEVDLRTLGSLKAQIVPVDVSSTGSTPVGITGGQEVTSSDGRYVGFDGSASGLVNPDPTNHQQAYLRYNANPSIPLGQLLGFCSACAEAASGQPAGPGGGALGIAGEPVNLAIGNLTESITDATLPNIGTPFAFARTYNSLDTTTQPFPPGTPNAKMPIPMSLGWTSTYNVYLRTTSWDGGVTLHMGDGQQLQFTCAVPSLCTGAATLLSGAGNHDSLAHNGDGTWTLTRNGLGTYTFNSTGNITSMKDRNGEGFTFSYTSGKISTIAGNAGSWTVSLTYTNGQLTGLSLPPSRSVGYHYDGSGLLDQVTDLRGNPIKYRYDASNRLNKITDQNNRVVNQTTYGPDGRVQSQINARGDSLSYSWNATTETAMYTDARGKVWTYGFTNGAMTSLTDPLGKVTLYGFDGDLNQSTLTDCRTSTNGCAPPPNCPAGSTCYTTVYKYDSSGNLIEEDDPAPLSYVKIWAYNTDNTLQSFADARSPTRTTRYEYDANGNLTCVLLANAGVSTCGAAAQANKIVYTRDPGGTGQLASVTDPNGSVTSYGHDALGDVTSVTTQLANVSRFCYDTGGRITSSIDPRAPTTEDCAHPGLFTSTYGYNAADLPTSAQDPLGHLTQWGYDNDGYLASRTDANNHVLRYEYDNAHNLTCVIAPDTSAQTCATAPATSTTTYTYNKNDEVSGRTDGNAHAWSYAYDNASRLQSVTSPGNKVWSYAYWDDGLLHVKTRPSTGTITYDYDALKRLSGITYSDAPNTPNITLGYDGADNRTSMTEAKTPSVTTNYAYDDLNRMSTATRGTDNPFSYAYYPGGQLKQITYPDSAIVGYTYDGDSRLCAVTLAAPPTSCASPASTTTTYGYDAANDLTTKTFPSSNGYVATLSYDNADRFTGVTNVRSGSTLSSYSFGSLDGVGNPQSLTALSGGTTTATYYTYDPYDRLTGACNLSGCTGTGLTGLGFTYDPVGNRLTKIAYGNPNVTTSYKYNSDDKLCWTVVGSSSNGCANTPNGGTGYGFDANGNETSAGSTTYAYDLENRMTSATVSGTPTSYVYDGDGNRVSTSTGGSTTNYVWDVNQSLPLLAIERNGSGSTLRDYSYGTGLNSMSSGGSNYVYLLDAYSGVANITSSTGATEWTYGYDAFGNDAGTTKNDPNAPTNVMRFDSQLLDGAAGLYDLRARTLDPSIARFSQIDPAGTPAAEPQAAGYVYALDDPTRVSDPSGEYGLVPSACPPGYQSSPGIPALCVNGPPGTGDPLQALLHLGRRCVHAVADYFSWHSIEQRYLNSPFNPDWNPYCVSANRSLCPPSPNLAGVLNKGVLGACIAVGFVSEVVGTLTKVEPNPYLRVATLACVALDILHKGQS